MWIIKKNKTGHMDNCRKIVSCYMFTDYIILLTFKKSSRLAIIKLKKNSVLFSFQPVPVFGIFRGNYFD